MNLVKLHGFIRNCSPFFFFFLYKLVALHAINNTSQMKVKKELFLGQKSEKGTQAKAFTKLRLLKSN